MFSGGRDSFLSCCHRVEEGDRVLLVTYENGSGLGGSNVEHAVARLKEAYGDRVGFHGVQNIAGIWRQFQLPFLNLTPSEIAAKWGEMTASQFNCLSCRSAMYVHAAALCRKAGIGRIVTGTRWNQGFAVEQESVIGRIRQLLARYSIELELPVFDLESDWERKNQLLMRGFVPKTIEPQCLIGAPLPEGGVSRATQEAVERCFDDFIAPRAIELIEGEKVPVAMVARSGRMI